MRASNGFGWRLFPGYPVRILSQGRSATRLLSLLEKNSSGNQFITRDCLLSSCVLGVDIAIDGLFMVSLRQEPDSFQVISFKLQLNYCSLYDDISSFYRLLEHQRWFINLYPWELIIVSGQKSLLKLWFCKNVVVARTDAIKNAFRVFSSLPW